MSLFCALNVSAQSRESDIRVLPPNQTFEREMTGAETHRYKLDLKAGEFFQVRVEQKGVDVLLKLLDSEGSVLATMDSPNKARKDLKHFPLLPKLTDSPNLPNDSVTVR